MARAKILKRDVDLILDCVNRNLPQQSDSIRREFKADYAHQYGGWMICYYDGSAKATYPFSQYRIPHAEAYKYFQGILFALKSL